MSNSSEIIHGTNSLPFVVQYRRRDDGIHWIDMAAYDSQMIAENYRDQCAGDDVPWEYRVEDRSPSAPFKSPLNPIT